MERAPNLSGSGVSYKDTLKFNFMSSGMLWADFKISSDQKTLSIDNFDSTAVPDKLNVLQPDDQTLVLSGNIPRGEIEVKLRRRGKDQYPLTSRGFRWISEVPFNR